MADCLNKRPIELKEPIYINDVITWNIWVPCGICARCIERRKMEWSFRMFHEMNISKCAWFVTLTYNGDNVPINDRGRYTLEPKDLTLFFKRLRQNQLRSQNTFEHVFKNLKKNDKIKYFAAGEYGEKKGRPHFHAIVFNCSEDVIYKSWELGNVHCVPANYATICYVMKYLDKRLGGYKPKNKVAEYNTMSEGIGLSYVNKMKDWHRRNLDILYVVLPNGIKVPMPRYFRKAIFNEMERKAQISIVVKSLEDMKIEELKLYNGNEEVYARKQREKRKVSELNFKKKMKRRIID